MRDLDDTRLRDAARAWLAATDRLAAALGRDDETVTTMQLAEAATIARLQLQQVLMSMGWTPPQSVREPQAGSQAQDA